MLGARPGRRPPDLRRARRGRRRGAVPRRPRDDARRRPAVPVPALRRQGRPPHAGRGGRRRRHLRGPLPPAPRVAHRRVPARHRQRRRRPRLREGRRRRRQRARRPPRRGLRRQRHRLPGVVPLRRPRPPPPAPGRRRPVPDPLPGLAAPARLRRGRRGASRRWSSTPRPGRPATHRGRAAHVGPAAASSSPAPSPSSAAVADGSARRRRVPARCASGRRTAPGWPTRCGRCSPAPSTSSSSRPTASRRRDEGGPRLDGRSPSRAVRRLPRRRRASTTPGSARCSTSCSRRSTGGA